MTSALRPRPSRSCWDGKGTKGTGGYLTPTTKITKPSKYAMDEIGDRVTVLKRIEHVVHHESIKSMYLFEMYVNFRDISSNFPIDSS